MELGRVDSTQFQFWVNNNITRPFNAIAGACRAMSVFASDSSGSTTVQAERSVARDEVGAASRPNQDYPRLLRAVLDAMPQALLAVSADGTPIFTNASARNVLKRKDGIQLRAGRLTAARARDARRLAACLAEIGSAEPKHRNGKWLRVERRRGLPYAVLIAPLLCSSVRTRASGESCVAVVIVVDLDRQLDIEPQVLQELFGLTRAEARLSCALLSGHGVEGAAAWLHVSQNTARTHIRSIFAKLHLSKQQQLVRILSTLTSLEPSRDEA